MQPDPTNNERDCEEGEKPFQRLTYEAMMQQLGKNPVAFREVPVLVQL
jgi:hypothetical protein